MLKPIVLVGGLICEVETPLAFPVVKLKSGSVYWFDLGTNKNKFRALIVKVTSLKTFWLAINWSGKRYPKETSLILNEAALCIKLEDASL